MTVKAKPRTKANRKRRTSGHRSWKTPKNKRRRLDRLIQAIPGYDPVATAEDCWFDYDEAQLALDFFPEHLTHVKGALAGQPFRLARWEAATVANIFGWKRPDGTRRYREVFILIGRKNGKTTFAAGIGTFVLHCDEEPGAEVYSAATERLQASLVFDVASGMVRNNPALKARCTIYGGGPTGQAKAIALNDHSGVWKVLSGDYKTADGLNTHCLVLDELQAQPNRQLVDILLTSIGSRRQPLIIHITTADYDRPSICNEKRDHAERVCDGRRKDSAFLPVIFAADPKDDWRKLATWRKASPNLGVSVSVDYVRRECKHAQETPAYENNFKRLHLNIKTEQEVRWLALQAWDRCGEAFDPVTLYGATCYAGLDLSSTKDLSSLELFFPENDNALLSYFWIPADNARARETRDKVEYLTWAKQGHLEMTRGNVIDYDVIRARINELGETFNIQEIAVDRWNSTQLQTQLIGDGFDVIPFGQGFASMSAPTKELEKLILSGALRHGGHPVLRWNAGNVTVEMDAAGNLKPSKKKSTEKIDGIVAAIMAIGRAMVRGEAGSIYEEQGIMTL